MKKARKVPQTKIVGWASTKKKNTELTEQTGYLHWFQWSKTHLNNYRTSKHLVQNELIWPQQNHVGGLKPHAKHNVWTSNWTRSQLSVMSRASLDHFNKANNHVGTAVLRTNTDCNHLWWNTNMRKVSQGLIIEWLILRKILFSKNACRFLSVAEIVEWRKTKIECLWHLWVAVIQTAATQKCGCIEINKWRLLSAIYKYIFWWWCTIALFKS